MISVRQLCYVVILVAACTPGTKPPATTQDTKEKRVFEVKSTDDLPGLYYQYLELVSRGWSGTVEVVFAPGVYVSGTLGLAESPTDPPITDPKIDLVVRGAAEGVVLKGVGLELTGRTVRLENLVLSGGTQPLLKARVGESLTMQRCAVLGNSASGMAGRALLAVTGLHAAQIVVEDSWFVGNTEASPSTLLAVAPAPQSQSLVDVAIRRSVFVANGFTTDVSLERAGVLLDDVIVHRTWPVGVFLRQQACRSVSIKGSILALQKLAQIGSGAAEPVNLTDSLLRTSTLNDVVPPGLAIDPGQIRVQPLAADPTIEEATRLPADRLPSDALRPRLRTALTR